MKRPYTIHVGDCREVLATLPEQHFHCCVTSPPYFGLRDYGVDGQIGLEPTPDDFVAAMVEVFRGVWRVLRDDGVVWLNIGDSYSGSNQTGGTNSISGTGKSQPHCRVKVDHDAKPKDLLGIPWRVAFALQSDGWYLRDAVIWHKPAPMPGSQRDRCTSSYEFVFQLTKKPRYFFDLEAVKEPSEPISVARLAQDIDGQNGSTRAHGGVKNNGNMKAVGGSYRTPRNVWKIAHEGFSGAHFATFPRELPMRCIKASTSEKGCCPACGAPWVRVVDRGKEIPLGHANSRKAIELIGEYRGESSVSSSGMASNTTRETQTIGWEPGCGCEDPDPSTFTHILPPVPCRVLDPFGGAGTTAIAACLLGRECDLIELNQEYADMAESRIAKELKPSTARTDNDEPAPLFSAG